MKSLIVDIRSANRQSGSMKKKPKKAAVKKKPARKAKPDGSQIALSVVERAIGGKLSDGMKPAAPNCCARRMVRGCCARPRVFYPAIIYWAHPRQHLQTPHCGRQ